MDLFKNDICNVCEKQFSSRQILQEHYTIHTGVMKFACQVCSKKFATRQRMSKHLVVHKSDKPFKCDTCYYASKRKCDLQMHVRKTHRGEKPYVCKVCNESFSDRKARKKCENRHKGLVYSCQTCLVSYASETKLRAHEKFVHEGYEGLKCETCGKNFRDTDSLKKHRIVHGRRRWMCDVCGKEFSQKMSFNLHKQIHTGEKPHTCHICGKCFSRSSNLQTHIRAHNDERPWKCKLCDKNFSRKNYLTAHVQKIHEDEGKETENELQGKDAESSEGQGVGETKD